MTAQLNEYQRQLREALKLLAAPAEAQIIYLKNLGVFPSVDELALEFYDLAVLADSKLQEGQINASQYRSAREIDSKLAEISGEKNTGLWEPNALFNAPSWEEVRSMAKQALPLFNDAN
jgi:hypothetical protein